MKNVELLAPGGDPLAVKAAILAGADAVFLGVGDFNARKRAVNISLDDLTQLCTIAHSRSCRIYLTFNTLALEPEIPALIDLLHRAISAGIDAVIVQDYGLLALIHELFPALEIHGSTQMTTHNRGQIRFVQPFGVTQINFSRELSLTEIAELNKAAHESNMLSEIFVHGAFCVSFSGQCYFSNVLHDNTANRGACVQPCRRSYTTEPKSIGSTSIQPLNLKDNSLYASAKELIDCGCDSLKIEGRIKGFEYVYRTVSAWRDQVDQVEQQRESNREDRRLTAVFNRSFSDNLLRGTLGKSSFTADSGDDSLREIGSVISYFADKKELAVSKGTPLPRGLSITIRRKNGDFICTGTVRESLGNDRYRLAITNLLKGKIESGQTIFAQPFIADSEQLKQQIESISAEKVKLPLEITLSGSVGKPLTLVAQFAGKSATTSSESLLERADSRPAEHGAVKERLGKLGETPFYLAQCDCSALATDLFIPIKLINDLRRRAVEQLTPAETPVPSIPPLASANPVVHQKLAVAIRSADQLDQLPRDGSVLILFAIPASISNLDIEIAFFRDNPDLIPLFPPILIGDQFDRAEQLVRVLKPAMIFTENSGIAAVAKELDIRWIGGSHLNASNGFALKLFQDQGAIGALLESEMSLSQIESTTVPAQCELWGNLLAPVLFMNSRHCLVRNIRDCGKEFMDDTCIPSCSRESVIFDSANRPIIAVKQRGEYNALYAGNLRWSPQLIGHRKFNTLFLDCRTIHKRLTPQLPLNELVALAQSALNNPSAREKLTATFGKSSAPAPKGME